MGHGTDSHPNNIIRLIHLDRQSSNYTLFSLVHDVIGLGLRDLELSCIMAYRSCSVRNIGPCRQGP